MGSIATENETDVVVVGAGFGGCYLLKILRDAGLSVKVLEAGTTLGGVWCWNRYPGARVDCEMPWYGYSDRAIWNTWEWSERFPGWKENQAYFQHVAKVWDLSKDIKLRTRVTESRHANGKWQIKTSQGDTYIAKWFIAATGTSAKPHIPQWEGMQKFKGMMHHSSLWPEEPIDLNGKRVAVIGAGSTGVQVVSDVTKEASHVTQFIKTPNFSIPMRQRKISKEEIYTYKALIPHVFNVCRTNSRTGLPIVNTGRKVFDDDQETRQALWEE